MTMDPISDMLVSIRNGLKARLVKVATPASKLKAEIARVMKDAGYIEDAFVTSEFPKQLVIKLKYTDKAVAAITGLKRISKPGLRRYVTCAKILSSSDAHYLEDINMRENFIEAEENTPEAIIKALKNLA